RFGGAGGSVAGGPARVYAAIPLLDVVGDFPYAWDNGTRNNPADDETRVRQNDEIRQGDAVVRAALALAPTRELQLSLSGLGRRQGLAGFGTHLDPEARLTTLRGIASLTYTGRDDLGPAGRLQVQAYTIVSEQQFWDPPGILSYKPADTDDRTTTFGATVRAARAATPWLKLAGIADGRVETFQPTERRDGVEMTGAPSSRLFGSAGAEADAWWERPRLGVIPSLRWEGARDVHSGRTSFRELLPAGEPLFYSALLERLGLLQRATPALTFKANVGRYARQPSFLELYGDSGFVEGDPNLRPERAVNGDVGASVRLENARGALAIDGALFGAAVSDLIQFQQDAYGRSHPENVGRARILGVEASADGRLGPHGRLVAQATFTDARDTSDNTGSRGRQLPLRPRFRAYVRPEARAVAVGPVRAGVYADADVTGGNYIDAANFNQLPARLLFGAGATVEWPRAGLRVTASLQNIGNSSISDVTGLPLPGRALFVTLAGDTSRSEERIHP
ncbi:MAG TPA: TonB-dependent receptor, partial [Polyangia bacterium]|nr:TonB-dependent receptor [Polyangia bacterium]